VKIYLACFATGRGSGRVHGSSVGGDVMGYALAEDGHGLTSHYSSNKEFSKHDLGLTSNWKHDVYAKYYPEGFELVWIDDPDNSEEWKKVYSLNQETPEETSGN